MQTLHQAIQTYIQEQIKFHRHVIETDFKHPFVESGAFKALETVKLTIDNEPHLLRIPSAFYSRHDLRSEYHSYLATQINEPVDLPNWCLPGGYVDKPIGSPIGLGPNGLFCCLDLGIDDQYVSVKTVDGSIVQVLAKKPTDRILPFKFADCILGRCNQVTQEGYLLCNVCQ